MSPNVARLGPPGLLGITRGRGEPLSNDPGSQRIVQSQTGMVLLSGELAGRGLTRNNGIVQNLKKLGFGQEELKFVGFWLGKDRVRPM